MAIIIVTGSNGGIGSAICEHLRSMNYKVLGIDATADINDLDYFIRFDLATLTTTSVCEVLRNNILDFVKGQSVIGLVNNAATQVLSSLNETSIESFLRTMHINLVAPFALIKIACEIFESRKGKVVNIGSIHSNLTKPNFISYATSKAGLVGLTKAIAVEQGRNFQVNSISPAAISTDMLLSGFSSNPKAFSKLNSFHPSGKIGKPQDVAELVSFLLFNDCDFLNGSDFRLDGAISSRLYDPS